MFQRAHCKNGSADTDGAEERILTVLLQPLLDYKPDDIYNADETLLYYRVTPDGSYVILMSSSVVQRRPWIA